MVNIGRQIQPQEIPSPLPLSFDVEENSDPKRIETTCEKELISQNPCGEILVLPATANTAVSRFSPLQAKNVREPSSVCECSETKDAKASFWWRPLPRLPPFPGFLPVCTLLLDAGERLGGDGGQAERRGKKPSAPSARRVPFCTIWNRRGLRKTGFMQVYVRVLHRVT